MANSIRNPQSAIQNVLVVGGSGYVASLVLPLLPPEFHLRIYDQKPPEWASRRGGEGVTTNPSPLTSQPNDPTTARPHDPSPTHPHPHTWIQGNVTDSQSLESAAQGM